MQEVQHSVNHTNPVLLQLLKRHHQQLVAGRSAQHPLKPLPPASNVAPHKLHPLAVVLEILLPVAGIYVLAPEAGSEAVLGTQNSIPFCHQCIVWISYEEYRRIKFNSVLCTKHMQIIIPVYNNNNNKCNNIIMIIVVVVVVVVVVAVVVILIIAIKVIQAVKYMIVISTIIII